MRMQLSKAKFQEKLKRKFYSLKGIKEKKQQRKSDQTNQNKQNKQKTKNTNKTKKRIRLHLCLDS